MSQYMHVYIQVTDTTTKKRKEIKIPGILSLFMSWKFGIGEGFLMVVSWLELYCSENFIYMCIMSLRHQHYTILKVKLLKINTLIDCLAGEIVRSLSCCLPLWNSNFYYLFKPIWEIFTLLTVKVVGVRIAASNHSRCRQRGGALGAGMNLFDRFARVVKVRFQESFICIYVIFIVVFLSWWLLTVV